MTTTRLIAVAAVAAALVTACSSTPDTPSPAPSNLVIVTVGAAGADSVAYTDPYGPGGVTSKVFDSVFSIQVAVTRGSTVNVTLSGIGGFVAPKCWISDATDKLTYVQGQSTCTYVAN